MRDRRLFLPFIVLSWCLPGMVLGATAAPVVYDFVDKFPAAEVRTATGLITLGSAEARPLLIDGWATKGARAQHWTWGLGDESSLRFFAGEPNDLTVSFRAWPFAFKNAPEQRITVLVNGQTINHLTLRREPGQYQFAIPRSAVKAGENHLEFQYAYNRAPSSVNPQSKDTRPLAVAWDWIQIGRSRPVAPPSVGTSDGHPALIVPSGNELDYFVKIEPGTVLTFDDLVPIARGATNAHPELRLRIETADTPPRDLPIPRAASGATRTVALNVSRQEIARVAFQVADGAAAGEADGWRLVRPALRSERAPSAAVPHAAVSPLASHPNIIIYLIDTLRVDHLGCYGYAKPTTPHIDAFARDGVRFTTALAQSSHTKPAVTSILTGLIPQVHGLELNEHALPDAAVTLAEVLQQAGYQTAGFTTNAQVSPEVGFSQGFDVYELLMSPGHPTRTASAHEVNARVFDWLDKRVSGRPFFLFVHTIDPHTPYAPPPEFRDRFAPQVTKPDAGDIKDKHALLTAADRDYLIPLYDAEIAANDDGFGELVGRLQKNGLYDSSLILLIADHGEEFYDHGSWEHGGTLYQEVVHVPLIMKLPGQQAAGRAVTETVQQIDVLPTMASAGGGKVPAGAGGRNLLLLVSGEQDGSAPIVIAYRATRNGRILESVVSGHTKLIRNLSDRLPAVELYDLDNDPTELHNVAADQPVMTGYLRALLTERATQAPAAPQVQLNDETRERLRVLGY